jgi:hypothetical protein
MILTSNAGGISGADTNIPLMQFFNEIFYKQAVPISCFISVVATLFRFAINY